MSLNPDVLVIGSGIAGLSAALAITDRDVAVLCAGEPGHDGSSWLAQGGLAAAVGPDDDPQAHARDTLAAGAGLALAAPVRDLTAGAPGAVAWLSELGVAFDRNRDGTLRLGREGAHGAHRIVHAGGDATGAAIMAVLVEAARRRPIITLLGDHRVLALGLDGARVAGCWVRHDGAVAFLPASDVVLACGGSGGLFARTTNPATVAGAAIALAAGVGARLADLEFVQFHPTALAIAGDGDALPLVTEALRGAGAQLVDEARRPIMAGLHPALDLAPRDVVAAAIHRCHADGRRVFLDATEAVGTRFASRFPTVHAHCRAAGIDAATTPIPVTPAAHYHMGGVAVDAVGRSSVPGLWACGEAARSGVHGANRLASNSLVEGVVFGRRLGRALASGPRRVAPRQTPGDAPQDATAAGVTESLRAAMWAQASLERTGAGLACLVETLAAWRARPHSPEEDLQLVAAEAIARAAWARRVSLGAHQRVDAELRRTA